MTHVLPLSILLQSNPHDLRAAVMAKVYPLRKVDLALILDGEHPKCLDINRLNHVRLPIQIHTHVGK